MHISDRAHNCTGVFCVDDLGIGSCLSEYCLIFRDDILGFDSQMIAESKCPARCLPFGYWRCRNGTVTREPCFANRWPLVIRIPRPHSCLQDAREWLPFAGIRHLSRCEGIHQHIAPVALAKKTRHDLILSVLAWVIYSIDNETGCSFLGSLVEQRN